MGTPRPSRGDSDGSPRPSGGRGPRPPRAERHDRDQTRERLADAAKNWGGVARRGASQLGRDDLQGGYDDRRHEEDQAQEAWEPDEVWIAEQPAEQTTPGTPGDGSPKGEKGKVHVRHTVPASVVNEVVAGAGQVRGPRLASRVAEASHAYDRGRYGEAVTILRPIAKEVPSAMAVRELFGLALYRQSAWKEAIRELTAYKEGSGSFDQHPVLADCLRALTRYDEAEVLWDELREASPDPDLVAEGRIVAAGCYADQGELPKAIDLMEKASKKVASPKERHLRQWYVLADLYERAGELQRSREYFTRIRNVDPEAFDVVARLRALR